MLSIRQEILPLSVGLQIDAQPSALGTHMKIAVTRKTSRGSVTSGDDQRAGPQANGEEWTKTRMTPRKRACSLL